MPEVYAALIGASATAIVVMISNMSNKRERDIRDIYFRLNKLSEAVSKIEGKSITCAMFGKTNKLCTKF